MVVLGRTAPMRTLDFQKDLQAGAQGHGIFGFGPGVREYTDLGKPHN